MQTPNNITTLLIMLLVMLIPSLAIAQPPKKVQVLPDYTLKFSLKTSASPKTIWRLWKDVENWKEFDTLLEYSRLDKGHQFETGSKGVLKAKGAPRTRFELIEVKQGVSFIEKLNVPLFQSIELQRYFEQTDDNSTIFTHEVNFKGRLRFLIYAAAANTFKKELPLVMKRLKVIAEQEEAALNPEK